MDLALPPLPEAAAPRSALDPGRPAPGAEAAEEFALALQALLSPPPEAGGVLLDPVPTLSAAPPSAESVALAEGEEAQEEAPPPEEEARAVEEEGGRVGDPAQAFFVLRLVPDAVARALAPLLPMSAPTAPPTEAEPGPDLPLRAAPETAPLGDGRPMEGPPPLAAAAPGAGAVSEKTVLKAPLEGGTGRAELVPVPVGGRAPLPQGDGPRGSVTEADGAAPPGPAALSLPGNRPMAAPAMAASAVSPAPVCATASLSDSAPPADGKAIVIALPEASPPGAAAPPSKAQLPGLPATPIGGLPTGLPQDVPPANREAPGVIAPPVAVTPPEERGKPPREAAAPRRAEDPAPVDVRRLAAGAAVTVTPSGSTIARAAAGPEGAWPLQEPAPREMVGGLGHGPLAQAALELRPVLAHAEAPRAAPPLQHQIAVAIREAGAPALEVRLEPEELGLLRIALRPEGEHLRVHLQAERGETLELLRRSAGELAQALHEAGHGSTSFSFQRWGAQAEPRAAPPPEEERAERPPPEPPSASPRRISGGRLDLRI